MAAPTPYIFVHCPSATIVTRVGLVAETGAQPILLNRVRANSSLQYDKLEDKYGDVYAEAWGNRSLEFRLNMDQLAQYGLSDSYLGRFDTTLLNNLALNFGIDPTNSGIALLTQGSRELVAGKLASVDLTIRVEDTRNAGYGSPDGASTPAWGTSPGGTKPVITLSPDQTGTIGSAFSVTITVTGTATITFALAPGQSLPAGLSLNTSTGAITGTPTGSASQNWIEIRASNAYGTTAFILHLTISAAAVAPPATIQTYVRYLVDSDSATVPDGYWAVAYSGMASNPTDEANFYALTPTDADYTATDPGLPLNPAARTGTISGVRNWEIVEIYSWNGTAYTYLYQKASTDTVLATQVAAGGDILTNASEPFTMERDIGDAGPSEPAAASWPGTIVPSTARITQYILYKDYGTGLTHCFARGGSAVYPNIVALLEQNPFLSLNWTETKQQVLLEVYNNTGSPAYIYQQASSNTAISTALGLTKSPVFHAAQRAGSLSTSIPEHLAAFTALSLPSPPSVTTGPAPDAEAWCYYLIRLWGNGARQVYGYRANAPSTLTLPRFVTFLHDIPLSRTAHDEMTAGRDWLEEFWFKESGTTWKAYYLDAALSASTSVIGKALADGVSPIFNSEGYRGQLFTMPSGTAVNI